MHPILNIAIKAARQAGDIIMRQLPRSRTLKVGSKGHNDFVSEVDKLAENAIIDTIRTAFPDHGILAEESGIQGSLEDEFLWIIDPLDGTTNYLHGYPQFGVSIALKHRGILDQAVIYDPFRQELFTASRGQGAQLDNRRIRVGKLEKLEGALLGTGFPVRRHDCLDAYLDTFRALFIECAGVRRAGAACLDLAHLACGRLDGFWEFSLKEWDVAAGALIIQEAGGLVGDPSGGFTHLATGNIVAGNPRLFKTIIQILNAPDIAPSLQRCLQR